jgi:hypothetical protein
VLTRIARRLFAMSAAIWQNWYSDVTRKRSLIACDH